MSWFVQGAGRFVRRVAFAWLVLSCLSGAVAISFTVQVVALSDRDAALSLQSRLAADGYPVYLVGFQSGTDTVYRLRVGAFANRGAAQAFADVMAQVEGSAAVPALAEGIPMGLIPLEPELIASYPYVPGLTGVQVLPWDEAFAVRFQGSFEGSPFEAEYRVLTAEHARRPVRAWRAAPLPAVPGGSDSSDAGSSFEPDGVDVVLAEDETEGTDDGAAAGADETEALASSEGSDGEPGDGGSAQRVEPSPGALREREPSYVWRVRNANLWPEDWESLEDEARDRFEEERLVLLADALGQSRERLRDYRFFQPGSGIPYLVIADRLSLSDGLLERLPAIGVPNGDPPWSGPELTWFGPRPEGFPETAVAAVFDPFAVLGEAPRRIAMPAPDTLSLTGVGWRAAPDGDYTRLVLADGSRSWRAVPGYPLWADDAFLLVYDRGELKLYSFEFR